MLPGLEARLSDELGNSVLPSEKPEEAVLSGAAAWSTRSNGDMADVKPVRKKR